MIATPIPITPVPAPTRQDMLKSALVAAQNLEEQNNWAKSLDAYLAIVRDYPDSPVGKNHLETMLNHLRDRPSPITLDEFQGMREQITDSAQLGILSAMLLIGDSLRVAEPQTALHWFSVAAEQGDPTGQYLLGLMYDKGFGVSFNIVLAHKWLNLAAAHAPRRNRENVLRLRDAVASKMTRPQLDLAQQLAVDFVPIR